MRFVLRGVFAFVLVSFIAPVALANDLLLVVSRIDDFLNPDDEFRAEIEVRLDDVGTTSITASFGTQVVDLHTNDELEWSAEGQLENLAEVQSELDGTWTIEITGGPFASTTTFVLSAASFQDADFFATATILQPTDGAMSVSPEVNFSWSDPTGIETADFLIVETEGGEQDQEDNNLDGTLLITDEIWQPEALLPLGMNEFSVFYGKADASCVTPLNVTAGSIVWSLSGFAPPGYPTGDPLLVLSSDTIVSFDVSVLETFELFSQIDANGMTFMDGKEMVTSYLVVDGAGDPVASADDALASSTGIADESGNLVWTLGTTAGTPSTIEGLDGFLLFGSVPAFAPPELGNSGPISDFFADPADFNGLRLAAEVKQSSGTGATQFAFVLEDAGGNAIATDLMNIGSEFATFTADVPDFVTLVESPGPFDFSQVTSIGLGFFTDPGSNAPVGAFEFRVDDVEISVPEPAASAAISAALLCLMGLAALRRRERC